MDEPPDHGEGPRQHPGEHRPPGRRWRVHRPVHDACAVRLRARHGACRAAPARGGASRHTPCKSRLGLRRSGAPACPRSAAAVAAARAVQAPDACGRRARRGGLLRAVLRALPAARERNPTPVAMPQRAATTPPARALGGARRADCWAHASVTPRRTARWAQPASPSTVPLKQALTRHGLRLVRRATPTARLTSCGRARRPPPARRTERALGTPRCAHCTAPARSLHQRRTVDPGAALPSRARGHGGLITTHTTFGSDGSRARADSVRRKSSEGCGAARRRRAPALLLPRSLAAAGRARMPAD